MPESVRATFSFRVFFSCVSCVKKLVCSAFVESTTRLPPDRQPKKQDEPLLNIGRSYTRWKPHPKNHLYHSQYHACGHSLTPKLALKCKNFEPSRANIGSKVGWLEATQLCAQSLVAKRGALKPLSQTRGFLANNTSALPLEKRCPRDRFGFFK